jgi:D-alanyl-D-alanine carboxypeptidase/D-alanyl-D-alanine-endopeptidase (penicillin-binding protein 4)
VSGEGRRAAAATVGVVLAVASLSGLWIATGSSARTAAALQGTAATRSPSASPSPAPTGTPTRGLATGIGLAAPGAVIPTAAPSVLGLLDSSAPVPSPAVLRARLGPLLAELGGSVSLDVVDPLTGQHLASSAAAAPRVPASTAKLLTGAAALAALGPDTTLPTTVVDGPAVGQITLVGGGDVLLSAGAGVRGAVAGHAGLATLAASTARALKAAGRTRVVLRLDDSLFAAPAVSPDWAPGDIRQGFVAPVMALEVNAGRVGSARFSRRAADPAMAAATTFATLLRRDGISVTGSVARARAGGSVTPLAAVHSAPVGDLVEFALTESDNTLAEVLGRLVALRTDRPATFDGAAAAVLQRIADLDVPTSRVVLVGGSGLGIANQIPAATLTGVLVAAASPQHPELRPLLSGLPVAAASGTLAGRFDSGDQRFGAGIVRAKTGTLSGVNSLAGIVVDADGRMLVFAVIADAVTHPGATVRAIDDVAITLAGCGCR